MNIKFHILKAPKTTSKAPCKISTCILHNMRDPILHNPQLLITYFTLQPLQPFQVSIHNGDLMTPYGNRLKLKISKASRPTNGHHGTLSTCTFHSFSNPT